MARLAESFRLILTAARDAWTSCNETDLSYLLKLTEDRSGMMERLRVPTKAPMPPRKIPSFSTPPLSSSA